jgi:hypothetical protein
MRLKTRFDDRSRFDVAVFISRYLAE